MNSQRTAFLLCVALWQRICIDDISVEHGKKIKPEEMEGLKKRVTARIKEELNFKAYVTVVPPGSIERTEMGKAVRVIRTYG